MSSYCCQTCSQTHLGWESDSGFNDAAVLLFGHQLQNSLKFQNHIFASVGFPPRFLILKHGGENQSSLIYIFSSYCWTSGFAAVLSMHPVFLCPQTHVSATIIGSLPSKSQQLSVICENAFWLQSAFNSFQPHHIPLEFLIFCLLFWSNSSVRAIAAKRQLAITWNPWKCQIDGWDSGWWTSELPMHTNATKFCGKNTNTVGIQKKYRREEYLGWVKLMGAKVQKLMAAPIPRYCCNSSLDSRICTDTIVRTV